MEKPSFLNPNPERRKAKKEQNEAAKKIKDDAYLKARGEALNKKAEEEGAEKGKKSAQGLGLGKMLKKVGDVALKAATEETKGDKKKRVPSGFETAFGMDSTEQDSSGSKKKKETILDRLENL